MRGLFSRVRGANGRCLRKQAKGSTGFQPVRPGILARSRVGCRERDGVASSRVRLAEFAAPRSGAPWRGRSSTSPAQDASAFRLEARAPQERSFAAEYSLA